MFFRPKVPDVSLPTIGRGRAPLLFALAAGSMLVVARMLGAAGLTLRLLAVGVAALLGVQAFKTVKAAAGRIDGKRWLVLAGALAVDVTVSTNEHGINLARAAFLAGLIVMVWLRWALPGARLLRRVTLATPALTLLIGILVGSAEPSRQVRDLTSAVSAEVTTRAPGMTSDLFEGVTRSLGGLVRWALAWLLGGA